MLPDYHIDLHLTYKYGYDVNRLILLVTSASEKVWMLSLSARINPDVEVNAMFGLNSA